MNRHRWDRVEEDMRRSPLERRPLLDRCHRCGVYRATIELDDTWLTYYGVPYRGMSRKRPECVDRRIRAMPQASDEQRELMGRWFGDPIDDGPPYKFLMARGYSDRAGLLIKPTPAHTVSEYEWSCICFLCDEWDYGFDPKLGER